MTTMTAHARFIATLDELTETARNTWAEDMHDDYVPIVTVHCGGCDEPMPITYGEFATVDDIEHECGSGVDLIWCRRHGSDVTDEQLIVAAWLYEGVSR